MQHCFVPLIILISIGEAQLNGLVRRVRDHHAKPISLPAALINAEQIKHFLVLWGLFGPENQLSRFDDRCDSRYDLKLGHQFDLASESCTLKLL